MKKTVVLFVVVILLLAGSGSAFAETPLNKAVDDLVGVKYKYAGTTENGFDCSGFTMYLFNQFGIDLDHQSKAQNTEGYWIAKEDLRAGDLVFFNTDGKGISHVGVYLGDGVFAHSANNVGVTKTNLNDAYYSKRYVSARRILWDDLYKQLTTDESAPASLATAEAPASAPAAQ